MKPAVALLFTRAECPHLHEHQPQLGRSSTPRPSRSLLEASYPAGARQGRVLPGMVFPPVKPHRYDHMVASLAPSVLRPSHLVDTIALNFYSN